MGGVKKTTFVTHIHNKLIENPNTFDHVFWITVSQDYSIHKLQNDIAKIVHLDLSNVDDEKKRAEKLTETLMRRQQSILILDDVWNHFVLEKVGILVRVKGCKLILTTRSLDVCKDGLPSENQRGAPFSGRSLVLIFGESWAWTCTSS